ncbi:MAG: 5'-deoxynucleotidase [Clostridia bacterium]|nr:5'-deoxynucleotidase [Clostridia bacterium]
MGSTFFSFLGRMKYINRWALMRNTFEENLSTHSFEVAAIAHMLALIANRRFGKQYNAERAAAIGLYHDMPEILTGDLPTPVKYFNKDIVSAYAAVESAACEKLLGALPEDLREDLSPMLIPQKEDAELRRLVKAADKISAYIKTIEERHAGNTEFLAAEKSTRERIEALELPEADVFLREFIPAFEMTLDQLSDE